MDARPRPSVDRGFTLVEILVAIVLVGMLAAVVAVGAGALTGNGSTAACAASADATRTAALGQVGVTPAPDLTALVAAGALTVPAGTTVDPTGRAVIAPTWTMWFTPGTPPTIICTVGTGGSLWTPAALPAGTALWFDAAAPSTITTSGTSVTTWRDRSGASRHATASAPANQPTFGATAMGTMPGITFDGTSDRMPFDGTFVAGTSYTVSAVVARTSAKGYNPYLGGTNISPSNNLVLGWRANTTLMFAQWSNDLDVTVPAYSTPTPELHVFRLDTTSGRTTWRNGTLLGSLANTAPITSFNGAALGEYNGSYFSGTIGEVVITTTALSTSDRQKLEGYLAWKWGMQAQLPAGHPYLGAPPLTP